MAEHVSKTQIERFSISALPEEQLMTIANHLAACETCHEGLAETLRRQRGTEGIGFTLAPEFWLKHNHVDYEQLVGLADDKLGATDREIIDTHLSVCATCREDVRSFLAFRKEIEPELHVRYGPVAQEPRLREVPLWSWWRGLAWKPAYAAAIVLIGIALIIGGLFLKRRADTFQARQTPSPNVNLGAASQTPTPDNRAGNSPSPPPTPNESPIEKPNSAEAIVVLNDRGATITVDKSGNVSGLDDVPAPTRDEIAKVLVSERIERPSILKDLAGDNSSLRGSNSGQPFKLVSPMRTVTVSDRPTFKWEKVSGASAYRVYVNAPNGREVARSEELSPERTEWLVPKPLKRGEIYAWTVIAVVDGKEIVSPGPASPEMKFQVLSNKKLRELDGLKRTGSHLALGVFYAKVGMNYAAQRQFQELLRLNPKSKVALNLLRSLRTD